MAGWPVVCNPASSNTMVAGLEVVGSRAATYYPPVSVSVSSVHDVVFVGHNFPAGSAEHSAKESRAGTCTCSPTDAYVLVASMMTMTNTAVFVFVFVDDGC
jgi:hypothetical protein